MSAASSLSLVDSFQRPRRPHPRPFTGTYLLGFPRRPYTCQRNEARQLAGPSPAPDREPKAALLAQCSLGGRVPRDAECVMTAPSAPTAHPHQARAELQGEIPPLLLRKGALTCQ